MPLFAAYRIAFFLRPISQFLLLVCLFLSTLSLAGAAEPFSVAVQGVEGAIRENVEAALALPHGLVRDGRVEPVWAKRFARKAADKARRALEPFGYYDPQIKTDLQSVEGGYSLAVAIVPGEPVRVAEKNLRLIGPGADQPRLKQRVKAFPLVQGAPLRHDLYEEWKGELLAAAGGLGFLNARFTQHQIRVTRETLQAEIVVELDTGPMFLFGAISFSGADNYPQAVLRRYLTFAPGEAFAEAKLSQSKANLLDADKFRSVKVVAEPQLAGGQKVPVQIELTPMPQYQLRPGIGFGTDTGPRASLRFRNNNAFFLGHEMQADLLYAERRESLSGRYLVPLPGRLESMMAYSLQYQKERNDSFEASSLSTEASLTQGFTGGYKATLFINLSREDYRVGEEEARVTKLVMPGVRLAQRHWKFERPGRPSRGYSWLLEARGSSSTLGSDVSLLQGLANATLILPLPWESQLILRGEGGTTVQDSFADLPASMRFFAGGDQSVRGYAYKSLGPRDSNGDLAGGSHLAVASIELEKKLAEDWGLALFFDGGNAFDTFASFEMAKGAGFGLRRYTPVGPIKLDLARQVGEKGSYRLHFGIGFVW